MPGMLLMIHAIDRCHVPEAVHLVPFALLRICGVGEQTDDRRVVERLHAIFLLDSGQHVDASETEQYLS